MSERHSLIAPLWLWSGPSGGNWFFLSINGKTAEALAATALMNRLESGRRAGFGSVRVTVQIGETCWQTSAFPSTEHGWMVPVKAAVRKAEGLAAGEPVEVELTF